MKETAISRSIADDSELYDIISDSIADVRADLGRVLLLPPDLTRMHSGAGKITAMLYSMLKDHCVVDIMPALGTHEPMSLHECGKMFGEGIPFSCIKNHNWKTDVIKIGEIPGEFVSKVSGGLLDYDIDVEINKRLTDKTYDLIISIGQVVPHEVVGMANYSKNIFVGCGGRDIINKSHMLGAVYGMERLMGEDHSPVRKVLDYAEEKFLSDMPLMYILTVTTAIKDKVTIEGIFTGRSRKIFEEAVSLSREKNLNILGKRLEKVVVYLDEREFKSTWIGNKAIYRTRMAIADGGELVIIAPGVRKFGEDEKNDELIRKYGYAGKESILSSYKKNKDLQDNLSAAAHLIHGSSDGRFGITYAAKCMSEEQVRAVNFKYMDYEEAIKKYRPDKLREGCNILDDGEEVFFISNPALGLWKCID
jgi:nickel-dependent lactate racemase